MTGAPHEHEHAHVAGHPHPHPHPHDHADGHDHAHEHGGHGHGGHNHDHAHEHSGHEHSGHGHGGHGHTGHGHSHGLVDPSIKRSREGLRAVGLSLVVLSLTATLQVVVYVASGSVALLADLIHNFGDAATAIPLAIAFLLRSELAERRAGLFVVLAIFVSACVAGYEAVLRLVEPQRPDHLVALALAGAVGFAGNMVAAQIRSRAGKRLDSPALIADGDHARADAYVSLAVVASAGAVAAGAQVADPLIGLAITLVILRITAQSWRTVRDGHAHAHG